MASRFVLDTNTCIYIRRQRPAQVMDRFKLLKSGEVTISVITYGELAYGAEKSDNPQRACSYLDELVSLIEVLPLPTAAARLYGNIRTGLERKGEMIGANDIWIAAHALASELILVTNNEREFRRIPGLNVENWVK